MTTPTTRSSTRLTTDPSILNSESEPTRPPLSTRVLARRVDEVPRSGIRRFFDILATMTDVISLGVGEPDFDTPPQVIEAGRHSLASGRTHYASNYGTIELRRALAHHLERLYGVRYDPTEEILITIGASEALDVAVRATIDPGDEVVMHEPSYVSYRPAVIFAGGVPVGVPTTLDEDFALDPAKVEAAITPRTKAILINYPCNPTGAVLPTEVQDEIARIAVRHDLLVYSDEIYDRLVYGGYQMRTMSGLPGMRRRTVLMDRLYLRPIGDPRRDPQGPPVRDHVGPHRGPGRGAGGAQDRRAGRCPDGRPVRPAAANAGRRLQRHRPAHLRAARRLLRLPADLLDGPQQRCLRRGAAP
jgi:DNA-binding transcriptional MocR family regulator